MKSFSSEFLYQLFALLLSVIVVHSVYITVIRPSADAIMEEQFALEAAGEPYIPDRSVVVIVKDYEQEICFMLMFWAMAVMGYKARRALRERRQFGQSLLQTDEGTRILPEDARQLTRPLQALPEQEQEYLLPRALMAALHRFSATRNIQDVSNAVAEVCDTESARLDSELSMVRYIAWAIPSIGFIGTVRGMGEALGQAHRAVEGDIVGVTASLGVAFNSTLIALLISIVLMFLMHQLQLLQEKLVLDCHSYCDRHLVRHLRTE